MPDRLQEAFAPRSGEKQASRTAAMRQRLINAAIESLHELGYSAATTITIVKRAGVSRGALLHHFPTKIDLMLATAQHIVALQTAWYDEQLALIDDPVERFLAITPITWAALRQPTGMALLEIFMATRSDADLGRRFPAVAREIETVQQRGMWILAKGAGVTNRPAVRAMTDMLLATMRGLSIQLLFTDSDTTVENAMNLAIDWKKRWLGDVLAGRTEAE